MSTQPGPPIDNDERKGLIIFGRDVQQIPCFRNSFLYGISGGIGVGILTFLGTSRAKLATHVGFSTFFCSTLIYWFTCRYNWSKQRFHYNKLQAAMKQHALYEGTEKEKEMQNLEEA
ncbi:cytochrome c oxidase assembly protein COX20, mitochondrial [Condylostylus longicornis]|uniref:cytochrome c oxidase assembly protein COX20, mitochondrial n=1 Tax=Condylostylus longicornis TaxID=2530218 RepID=UPI00244E0FCE|nr:cytochrome c oxidase assembly protein COX20, mitochondrial [Condylostylus longicornis]